MGVSSDTLRNSSHCSSHSDYLTTSGWEFPGNLRFPGLSDCAKGELVAFVDTMRYVVLFGICRTFIVKLKKNRKLCQTPHAGMPKLRELHLRIAKVKQSS